VRICTGGGPTQGVRVVKPTTSRKSQAIHTRRSCCHCSAKDRCRSCSSVRTSWQRREVYRSPAQPGSRTRQARSRARTTAMSQYVLRNWPEHGEGSGPRVDSTLNTCRTARPCWSARGPHAVSTRSARGQRALAKRLAHGDRAIRSASSPPTSFSLRVMAPSIASFWSALGQHTVRAWSATGTLPRSPAW